MSQAMRSEILNILIFGLLHFVVTVFHASNARMKETTIVESHRSCVYEVYMAAWSKKHIAVDRLNVASIRSIPSSSHLISAQWCTSDRLLSAIGVENWEKSSNWNIALFVVCLFDMQKNIACTTYYSVNENIYIIGICLDSVGFWCGAVRSS